MNELVTISKLNDYQAAIEAIIAVAIFVLGFVLQRRSRLIESITVWQVYRADVRAFADEVINAMTDLEGLCEVNPEITKQAYWDSRNKIINRLSALRDRGKLILPNEYPEKYGQHKVAAYQGYRQAALDCVTVAFKVAIALDFKEESHNKLPISLEDKQHPQAIKLKEAFNKLPEGKPKIEGKDGGKWSCKSLCVEAKRRFVTEAQELINPRKWDQIISRSGWQKSSGRSG